MNDPVRVVDSLQPAAWGVVTAGIARLPELSRVCMEGEAGRPPPPEGGGLGTRLGGRVGLWSGRWDGPFIVSFAPSSSEKPSQVY